MIRSANSLAAAVLVALIVGAAAAKVPAFFILGDSLADTGTNDYIPGFSYPILPQSNVVPYGETFFHYPTGRWSNGRLMFDFISQYLNISFPEPYLKPGPNSKFYKGACFASGASGILNSTAAGQGVITLSTQLQQFETVVEDLYKDLGNATASYIVSNALYGISTGSNDITAYVSNATLLQTIPPEQFLGTLIVKLEAALIALISLGARKIVMIGQGPGGCSPVVLATTNSTGACLESLNEIALGFNEGLLELATGINAKINTTTVILSNRYNTTLDLILNGASKGFTEGTTGCCGAGPFNGLEYSCGRTPNYTLCSNVSNYVHWDFTHPTERVNRIVAHGMWHGNTSYIQPINIHQLVSL